MAKSTKYTVAQGRVMYVRMGEIRNSTIANTEVRLRVNACDFALEIFHSTSPAFKRALLAELTKLETTKQDDIRALIR